MINNYTQQLSACAVRSAKLKLSVDYTGSKDGVMGFTCS